MFTLTSPITGSAQTGFTAPTYTHVNDNAPDSNGRQVAVTAVGGTQVGVTTHTLASPFTLTFWKQRVNKILGRPNPITGLINNVPRNTQKFVTRKGVLVLAGQPFQTMIITTIIDVPAGADTVDAPNVRAALSAHIGGLTQQSAGVGDTAVTGIM